MHTTNRRYMKGFEHYLDETARMDMRVGRKPMNYNRIVGLVEKYKFEIKEVLKERKQIDMGVDPIKKIWERNYRYSKIEEFN